VCNLGFETTRPRKEERGEGGGGGTENGDSTQLRSAREKKGEGGGSETL